MTKEKKDIASIFRYMGPALDALKALGGSGTPDEVVERIAQDLNISDEAQNEILSSGEGRFHNRIRWARLYLVREGLVDSSRRGVWALTETGRRTNLSIDQARNLATKWNRIFAEERRARADSSEPIAEEGLELANVVTNDYRYQLIQTLKNLPPSGFERLSQRLLREAGFVQVVVTGSSGDGGIDGHGTLQINPLVSFKVLFQCKRYAKSVSPSQVRDFRGAMSGRTDKGIIITTGTFTAEARREASRDGVPPIELIDGEKLVDMLEHLELGLRPVQTYAVDTSFFDEFKN